MSSIDERVVQMQFQNSQFEKGVQESLKSIEALKKSLKFDEAAESLKKLQEAGNSLSLSKIGDDVDGLSERFSAFGTFAGRIIENLADSVYNKLGSALKEVTIGQIGSGWERYAEDTKAVQTIMFATGKSIEEVESELERLTWFTDETSYSYTDMVSNISKFTSAGVDLKDARVSMQGIATWAASAGQDAATASRVMYNASQALGAGAMKVADWKSIELANMATKEFKQNVIETAIAMGKLDAQGNVIINKKKKKKKIQVTSDSFRDTLRYGWFDNDVMNSVFGQYGEFAEKVKDLQDLYEEQYDIYLPTSEAMDMLSGSTSEFSEKAFRAAQEAKTFGEAIDALKDAATTKWMRIFKLIFGDYEHAKDLWTKLANDLYEVFVDPLDSLVDVFKEWHLVGDDGLSAWDDFMSGVYDIMDGLKGILITVRDAFSNLIPGVTLENLKSFSSAVKEFGANFKAAFGLPEEESEKVGEAVDSAYKKAEDSAKEFTKTITNLSSFNKEGTLGTEELKDFVALTKEGTATFGELQESLKRGSKGKDVKKMQEMLIALGYDLDKYGADGIFGPETQAALKEFERDTGIAIDGVFDAAEAQSLAECFELGEVKKGFEELGDSLKLGSTGEEVKTLQKRLKELGYDVGPIDGIYGPQTERAVKKFQFDAGTAVDGVYDAIEDHPAMKKAMGFDEVVEAVEETSKDVKNVTDNTKEAKDATEKYSTELSRLQAISGGIFALGGIMLKVFGLVGKVAGHIVVLASPLIDAFMTILAVIGDSLISFNQWLDESGALDKAFNSIKKTLEPVGKFISQIADSLLRFLGLKKPIAGTEKSVMTLSKAWKSFSGTIKKTGIIDAFKGAFASIKKAITDVINVFKGSDKKTENGFTKTLTDVLKVIGSLAMIPLGAIAIVIKLIGSLVTLAINQIPKVVDLFKGLWAALTFEGDESLGKAPGVLARVKKLLGEFYEFLFGEESKEGTGKVGIFTRLGRLLSGDIKGFTEGIKEETASKIESVLEHVKGVYNDVRAFLFGEESKEGTGKVGIFTRLGRLLSGDIKGFTEGIKEETASKIEAFLTNFQETIRLIKMLFTGEHDILVTDKEKSILDFRNNVIGYIDTIKKVFTDIGSAIKLLITGNAENTTLSKENADKVLAFRDGIIGFFNSIGPTFAKIWAAAKFLLTGKGGAEMLSPDTIKRLTDFRNNIKNFFVSLGTTFGDLWGQLKDIFKNGVTLDSIKQAIIAVWNSISGFFKSVWKSGKKLLRIGIIAFAVYKLLSIIDNVTDVFGSIKDILSGFNKKSGDTIGTTLLKIAGSIGIIAAAILLIGKFMKPEEFTQGLKALRMIATTIGLFMAASVLITKFKLAKGISKVSDLIFDIAKSIGIIAVSILLLGKMSDETFKNGAAKAAGIMVALGLFIVAVGWLSKKLGSQKTGLEGKVWQLAAIVIAMGVVAKMLSNLTVGQALIGVGSVTVLMIALGAFMAAIAKYGGKVKMKGLISLGFVIGIMAMIVKSLGKMKLGSALQGVGSLVVMMLALRYFLSLFSEQNKIDTKSMLAAFLGIGAIIAIFGFILRLIKDIDPRTMLSFSGSLAIALASFVAACSIIGKLGNKDESFLKNPMTKGAASIVASLAMFAVAALVLVGGAGALDALLGSIGVDDAFNRGKEVLSTVASAISGFVDGLGGPLSMVAFLAGGEAIGALGGLKIGKGDNAGKPGAGALMKGAGAIVTSLAMFAVAALVLVGGAGALDQILSDNGFEDVFNRGKEVLSTVASAISGFASGLGVSMGQFAAAIAGLLIFSEIVGATGTSGALMTGALAVGVSIDVLLACLELFVGANGLAEELSGGRWSEMIEKGGGVLEKFGEALGKFVGGFTDSLTTPIQDFAAAISEVRVAVDGLSAETKEGGGENQIQTDIKAALGIMDQIHGFFTQLVAKEIDTTGIDNFNNAIGKRGEGGIIDSVGAFGTNIAELWSGITGISTDETIQGDLSEAITIAQRLKDEFFDKVADQMPSGRGLSTYNTRMTYLLTLVGTFGENLGIFHTNISGFNTPTIEEDTTAAIDAATQVMRFLRYLKLHKEDIDLEDQGISAWFGEETSQTTVFTAIQRFSESMGGIQDELRGFTQSTIITDMQTAVAVAEAVTGLLAYIGREGAYLYAWDENKENVMAQVKAMFDPRNENSLVSILKTFDAEASNFTHFDAIADIFSGFASLAKYLSGDSTIESDFKQSGIDMMTNIITGFASTDLTQLDDIPTKILSIFNTHYNDFFVAGQNFTLGLANGTSYYGYVAIQAAEYVASRMLSRVQSIFNEHSPSKVTEQIGRYFSQGLSIGVEKDGDKAVDTTKDVAKSMLNVANGTLTNLSDLLAQDIDANPTIAPVVDLTNVRAASSSIKDIFGEQVSTGVTTTGKLAKRATLNGSGEDMSEEFGPNRYGHSADIHKVLRDMEAAMLKDKDGLNTTNMVTEIKSMSEKFGNLADSVSNMKLVLDTGALVGGTSSAYDKSFGNMTALKGRGN